MVMALFIYVDMSTTLDKFSTFRFNNSMQALIKLSRKSDKPLQQLPMYVETETNSSLSFFSRPSLYVAHPNVCSPH